MMSLVAKRFDDAKAGKPIRLFKSHRENIADGDQRRDFIYVDDAVAVVRWLLDNPTVSGIFNVGTGQARSFRDLVTAMFARARPRARDRVCRHAGRDPRSLSVFHRRPRSRSSAAPATTAASRRSRRRCRAMSAGISTSPTVTGNARTIVMHPIDQQLAKFGEMTVLCVGDLMLDHFVYGDVSRVSPEAPSLVIAVDARGAIAGRRRQRRARHRRARRALHLRRRHRRGRKRPRAGAGVCRRLWRRDRDASPGRCVAPDHPQGALRLRPPFDASAAGGLGAGRAAAAGHRAGADPGLPARAAARGCRGAVRLCQGRAEPGGHPRGHRQGARARQAGDRRSERLRFQRSIAAPR